jgi:hypothetical protein
MVVLLPAMLNPCFYLQEWGMPQINLASNVIAALRTFETGQVSSASFANSTNLVSSRFGTFARRVRAERLIRNPWPSGSSVIAASVLSSDSMARPARPLRE